MTRTSRVQATPGAGMAPQCNRRELVGRLGRGLPGSGRTGRRGAGREGPDEQHANANCDPYSHTNCYSDANAKRDTDMHAAR